MHVGNVLHLCSPRRPAGHVLHIVDFGCGSGHLGLLIAQRFAPAVRITLVDLNETKLAKAKRRAEEAGLGVSVAIFAGSVLAFQEHFDLAVSMHSCGPCTDAVLEACLRSSAAFSLVPCCYGQLPDAYGIGVQGNRGSKVDPSLAPPEGGWPRSHAYRIGLEADEFATIASAAEFALPASSSKRQPGDTLSWTRAERQRYHTAKACMRAVDADRLQHVREVGKYVCWQASLWPLDCSPKNNVICGLPTR